MEQPLRCRFCRQVFQARGQSSAASVATSNAQRSLWRVVFNSLRIAGLLAGALAVAALLFFVVLGPDARKSVKPEAIQQKSQAPEEKRADAAVAPGMDQTVASSKVDSSGEPVREPPKSELTPPPLDTSPKPAEKEKPPTVAEKSVPTQEKPQPEKKEAPVVMPAVKFILNELALLSPPTAEPAVTIDADKLTQFQQKVLSAYRTDYKTIMEFKDKEAEFPLRAAIAKTVQALRFNVNNTTMRPTIPGNLPDKQLQVFKNQVKAEQDILAKRTLILKDLVKELVETGDKHKANEIKRCQVLFDYALLRLKARLVHVVEYNFALARIRTDSLPDLGPDETIYRLTAQEKVSTNEAYIRQYVKDIKTGWTEMAKNNPGTPWAVLAPGEQAVRLGLAWEGGKK
jgi:hypothetical protein